MRSGASAVPRKKEEFISVGKPSNWMAKEGVLVMIWLNLKIKKST
jgi:hypothetical protein